MLRLRAAALFFRHIGVTKATYDNGRAVGGQLTLVYHDKDCDHIERIRRVINMEVRWTKFVLAAFIIILTLSVVWGYSKSQSEAHISLRAAAQERDIY